MSRIGRMPIAIPAGVTVDIAENNQVTVKGPKGTLERVLPAEMTITKEGEEVKVTRPNDLKKMKSLHGLEIHRWIENSPNKKKIDSVTGANAWIIGYISDKTKNNEDVFQKDLEKNFEITRSTASKVVNLMVEKGMVERQSVPWDARLKKLILTDKGREIDELMLEDFSVVEETLSKGFSEQELEQFFDYMHRMQQNMKDGFCNIGLKK